MTDGVLDLLTAILVLGVVVAICFGFVLPLTNPEYMKFDKDYQDKGAMSATIDYSSIDATDISVTQRMYTYEEMILMLSVQDARMDSSKAFNLRNLVTSQDLSYSGYSTAYQGNGKANALVNINNLSIDITDEAQRAILRYANNGMETGGDGEDARLMGTLASVTDPNVGYFSISDTFNLTKEKIITELNGAEQNNAQFNGEAPMTRYNDANRLADRRGNSYVAAAGTAITPPTPENRIYYVSHHFAIPDDSPYMQAAYKRNDDEKAAFYVEIKGPFVRAGKTYTADKPLDTYAEYQEYLRLYRATIKGNK